MGCASMPISNQTASKAIIVLRGRNRVKDLFSLIPALLDAIPKVEPGTTPLVLEAP